MAHKTTAQNTELRGLVLLIRCSYNFAANGSNRFIFTYPLWGSNSQAIPPNTIALTTKLRGLRGLMCLSKFPALAEQTRRTSLSKWSEQTNRTGSDNHVQYLGQGAPAMLHIEHIEHIQHIEHIERIERIESIEHIQHRHSRAKVGATGPKWVQAWKARKQDKKEKHEKQEHHEN